MIFIVMTSEKVVRRRWIGVIQEGGTFLRSGRVELNLTKYQLIIISIPLRIQYTHSSQDATNFGWGLIRQKQ